MVETKSLINVKINMLIIPTHVLSRLRIPAFSTEAYLLIVPVFSNGLEVLVLNLVVFLWFR